MKNPIDLNFSVKEKKTIVISEEGINTFMDQLKKNGDIDNGVLYVNIVSAGDRSDYSYGDIFVASHSFDINDQDKCIGVEVYIVAKDNSHRLINEAYRVGISLLADEIKSSKCDYDIVYVKSETPLKKTEALDIALMTEHGLRSVQKDRLIVVSKGNDMGKIEMSMDIDYMDDKKKKNKDKKKKKKGKKK